MFAYTGLSSEQVCTRLIMISEGPSLHVCISTCRSNMIFASLLQVDKIKNNYSVYMTKDGRMSVAGLSTKNVDIVARAMHEVSM